jgi:hypothetical protein
MSSFDESFLSMNFSSLFIYNDETYNSCKDYLKAHKIPINEYTNTLFEINYAKFSQNVELRRKLLNYKEIGTLSGPMLKVYKKLKETSDLIVACFGDDSDIE